MKKMQMRVLVPAAAVVFSAFGDAYAQPPCDRTIKADVVALDQAFYNNRLGAIQAGGMIFALRRDVVSTESPGGELKAGKVMLRPDKRPRPMVLRMNVGDCLEVQFQNLLAALPTVFNANSGSQRYPVRVDASGAYAANQNASTNQSAQAAFEALASQPATRLAGVHVMGLELVLAEAPPGTPIAPVAADGSWVGANDISPANAQQRASGLVGPGERIEYTYVAKAEGSFLLYSTGADVGEPLGFGGQLMQGLFGSVTVQPKTAEWYRSQVTKADLDLATDGKTADGHPIINYDKLYPSGHPREGLPILKMITAGNEIVSSDLTAIITGPNHGRFDCGSCPGGSCENCPALRTNPSYPDQTQPYREFAIHYHDDFVGTQAFEEFRKHTDPGQNDDMSYTLQGSRDFFAINYGMAGIGPEVWANRIKVGPMHDCATCRFEEFFLSSWAVGDPAMVVDFPANSVDPKTGNIKTGPKATKAFYPDDPSNVYHSYMGDHVKFQILHAGTNISHVHHLHAHQWLHTPNDDKSSYRDSQMISPGAAYTLNHTYAGSGNKNKTVGDAIFHCHFYPHFAQGMWSLWRVHDVFEGGTELDKELRPVAGFNRALPDGEIAVGTPIPALVPMPTLPMAPIAARVQLVPVNVPGSVAPAGFRAEVDMADPNIKNGPGFPFYIPGIGGQRVPHPPLDFAPDESDAVNPFLNGGLPRFVAVKEVGKIYEKHNRWDFTKFNDSLKAIRLDEAGTDVEKIAMAYHAQRLHDTFLPDGTAATGNAGFVLNGRPPIGGAPYADPAIELDGTPICPENKPPCLVRYKAADIQLDLVFNKKGQHYPQSRILTLWGDAKNTLAGTRAPEPFFFRANSTQVVEYWLANLVPNYYELDDFQVRTPTDVLGQHIHLVKFDVTASDGAANGFNYEDGSLSPPEVLELIENINNGGGLFADLGFKTAETLHPKAIPYFGPGDADAWLGAQATIQRWYADPVLSNNKADRTLRTVFTHDHFGPSTHQQVGLYAGLLVEPAGSQWQDPVSGVFLGTNLNRPVGANGQAPDDGGPTSWQANIVTSDPKESYREFAIEFGDRQLAYKRISKKTLVPYTRYNDPNPPCTPPAIPWGWADPPNALSPPLNDPNTCLFAPFPSIVTLAFQTGGYSLNYRNEPPVYRVNPNIGTPTAVQTDLSSVFRSIDRADGDLNVQPTGNLNSTCAGPTCFKFPPPQLGVDNRDPYTPILMAYEGDRVQIRTLVGAHMSPHFFTVHGVNWLFEPTQFDASDNTSGYRGTQGMGISEHYEMLFTLPRTVSASGIADYLYSSSSDVPGLSNGNWGIMRGYKALQPKYGPVPLPNNPPAKTVEDAPPAPPTCPAAAPQRNFTVVAARAFDVLNGPVVYNARGRAGAGGSQQIVNWNALAYFLADDLDPATGKLLPGKVAEPVILRANAGDCINITLKNRIPDTALNVGASSLGIAVQTSREVGLHPQLVAFDVTRNNGVNVGMNLPMTVKPGQQEDFKWYAGKIELNAGGTPTYVPVEFGSIPLTPSDPLRQHPYGLLGALIIEPAGTVWRPDDNSRASALVCKGGKTCTNDNILFREFVVVIQDDVSSLRETQYPPYPSTIAIMGSVVGGKVAWTMNGKALPSQGVALIPGQTVSFDIQTGTHGLLFQDEASARAVFDIDGSPDNAKFQVFPLQCTIKNSYGTVPQASGHIATLTVKQPITLSALPFLCSQHCQNMTGAFTIAMPATTPAPFNYTRAINYRTEPLDYRFAATDWLANIDAKSPIGIGRALSNSLVLADPETPVFAASANRPIRFRVVHPAGLAEQVFTLHGHVWQEEPYVNGSTEIGANALSQSQGSRDGVGPNVAFDAVIEKAGGASGVTGDYLYRTFIGSHFQFGTWGLFRVGPPGTDIVTISRFSNPTTTGGKVLIKGRITVNTGTGEMADEVTIFDTTGGAMNALGKVAVDQATGAWPADGAPFSASAAVKSILVRSAGNGEARASGYIVEVGQAPSVRRPDISDELSLFMPAPAKAENLLEATGTGSGARWLFNSDPLRSDRTIRVRPGDTITVSVKDGTHDLTFPDAAAAQRVFRFEMPGRPFASPRAGAKSITTRSQPGSEILATLTVRRDIPSSVKAVSFGSTADGQRLNATFVIVR